MWWWGGGSVLSPPMPLTLSFLPPCSRMDTTSARVEVPIWDLSSRVVEDILRECGVPSDDDHNGSSVVDDMLLQCGVPFEDPRPDRLLDVTATDGRIDVMKWDQYWSRHDEELSSFLFESGKADGTKGSDGHKRARTRTRATFLWRYGPCTRVRYSRVTFWK